jgi:uncharacterized protein YggL (DUF469 family)
MKKQKLIITLSLLALLCGILIYMAVSNKGPTAATVEGFSFVDKPKPTKLGERRQENFLANEIKTFAFNTPSKETMSDTPLRKLKKQSNNNNKSDNSNNNKKSNKLRSLAKKGQVDEFQNVLDEVDSMDVSSISIKGISDTIKRYNNNVENRLKYAKQKNNSNDLESAMAQYNVLKDEFVKIFSFADYF